MAWRGLKKKLFSPDFPIFAPHVHITTTTTSSSKQHIESSTNPANFYFEFQKAFYSSSSWAPPSSFLASVVVVLIGKSQFKYPIYNLDNFQINVCELEVHNLSGSFQAIMNTKSSPKFQEIQLCVVCKKAQRDYCPIWLDSNLTTSFLLPSGFFWNSQKRKCEEEHHFTSMHPWKLFMIPTNIKINRKGFPNKSASNSQTTPD